jgi:riboflavin synthase
MSNREPPRGDRALFTGLIRERGLVAVDPEPLGSPGTGGMRLVIAHGAELGRLLPAGASLAVAGVCLTVTGPGPSPAEPAGVDGARSAAEVTPETLARTTLGGLRRGDEVNLEPALRAGEPLGGHLVQGHVDGTARVLPWRELAGHRVLSVALPVELAPYLVFKGSVAVDGVSLTVAALPADPPARFEVALIPHTLAVTTLGRLAAGDRVNLEVDVLAKYVARQLALRGLATMPAQGGEEGEEEIWRP